MGHITFEGYLGWLDRRGTDVWQNERGWFFAMRAEMRASAPKQSGDSFHSPIQGPYPNIEGCVREAVAYTRFRRKQTYDKAFKAKYRLAERRMHEMRAS